MNKSKFYVYGFIAASVCFISIWLYYLFTPIPYQQGGDTYYLRPGTSKKLAIAELSKQGIIKHPILFSLYVFPQKSSLLKTGEYLFPKGSTPVSIWRQMTTGTGLLYHQFTIVPGWTFNQLRMELSKAQELRHITAAMDDKQIMERLGYPHYSPEGYFFPETYNYTRGVPDLIILKRACDLMQIKLNEAWENRSAGLPYKNTYEALIAASMIEKEGYLDSERPVISGVLINRLRKNMLLQIDATVIYGLGQRYDGKIHKADLLEDTVYNTYVHKGLPPTPIAMPGLSSITAAMHPQQNDYYYYVAKGDGSHQFSKSLSEHNAAVQSITNWQSGNINQMLIRRHVEFLMDQRLKQPSYNSLLNN